MGSLDVARAEVAFLVMYLNKAESRDKICRAIQYGAKFLSNGEPGPASQVDKSTSLARKVFRLLKYLNELHGLIVPAPKSTPLPIVLLGKAKNALVGTFLFLDQLVWAGRTGIYQNKERLELISRISLYCWMTGSFCTSLAEVSELGRLAASRRKLEREIRRLKQQGNPENAHLKEQKLVSVKQSHERTLSLVKASLDIVVAVGLLQLAPKTVTPRVTGALGFITSLISCYQLLPPPPASKPKSS
ncbi:hypothetical protein SELMODRAFT_437512 [Selaginella moellendorffii]|uniref:Uncharacterized protein n=1 Tax=Selaginella moellendorffii TaxID=88036 RepID=D8QMN8_SELML|nr:peroxisomal membrane protein 11C [Selaginella moellendorffii]XP_024532560.1 peroxisomal membrane protein 11C [Selaginella moellendorffii]EFJ38613.1 hypothetical protein SELMODRAFT_437512 [Selaginella moellendorffii]|eukprot:XP_002961074.1 peroxisomal membrane protein 11C [Selaginella moellendorffii]